ncbi:epithelial chloride channel protein-like [Platysternon megacephalum]|uniref:Epithelial chloride channel protein-like n=1 Tax=Platysternon megacephalum TaxID=55544 RepID=A0A4D9E667_9SAUR|nr:epithelial chloride channel protein-like [Platysternon megacephalum]
MHNAQTPLSSSRCSRDSQSRCLQPNVSLRCQRGGKNARNFVILFQLFFLLQSCDINERSTGWAGVCKSGKTEEETRAKRQLGGWEKGRVWWPVVVSKDRKQNNRT